MSLAGNSKTGSRSSSPNNKDKADKTKPDLKLQSLAAAHIAFRGHLTRRIKNARMLCDLSGQFTEPTISLLKDLQQAKVELREMFEKIEQSGQELMTKDSPDKIDSWQQKIDEDDSLFRKQESELCSVIAEAEMRLVPKPDYAKVAGAPAGRTKANDALKPKVLSREMTPVEFSSWITRFSAYYASSNMHNCSLPEQQAYFRACIDSYLEDRLQSKITPLTPVLPEDGKLSCLDLLNDEFLLNHPIFARRLDFFQAKQPHHQNFTDFAQNLMRMGDESHLADMTVDDVYVMRFLTSCSNLKLRDRLLKDTNPPPNRNKILQLAQNFEVSQRFTSAINKSQGQVRANQVSNNQHNSRPSPKVRDKRFQRSDRRFSNHRSSSHSDLRQVAKNRCHRCGAKIQGQHDCRALSATCFKCGKKGHLSPLCMSGRRQTGSNARSANNTPTRSRRNSFSTGKRNSARTVSADEAEISDSEVSASLVAEYLH